MEFNFTDPPTFNYTTAPPEVNTTGTIFADPSNFTSVEFYARTTWDFWSDAFGDLTPLLLWAAVYFTIYVIFKDFMAATVVALFLSLAMAALLPSGFSKMLMTMILILNVLIFFALLYMRR